MLPPTHLAGGYLIGQLTKSRSKTFSLWTVVVSFFAIFPDIDLLWLWSNHRYSALHFPIFWVAIFVSAWLLSKLKNDKSIATLGLAISLGGLIHIVMDSVGIFDGIYWLYPFSTARFSLLPVSVILPDHSLLTLFSVYLRHPIALLEAGIAAVAILHFLFRSDELVWLTAWLPTSITKKLPKRLKQR